MWKGRGGRYRDITAINWGGGRAAGGALRRGRGHAKPRPFRPPLPVYPKGGERAPKPHFFAPKSALPGLKSFDFSPQAHFSFPKTRFSTPKRPAQPPSLCSVPKIHVFHPKKLSVSLSAFLASQILPTFFPKNRIFPPQNRIIPPQNAFNTFQCRFVAPNSNRFDPNWVRFPLKSPHFTP